MLFDWVARPARRAGCRLRSAGTLSCDDRCGCRHQNLDVGPQRAVLGVAKVQTDHVIESRAAAAGDLPQTSDARLCFEDPPAMPRLVLIDFVLERRPWPDERHVAPKHIQELWQFVQTGFAQQPTD